MLIDENMEKNDPTSKENSTLLIEKGYVISYRAFLHQDANWLLNTGIQISDPLEGIYRVIKEKRRNI